MRPLAAKRLAAGLCYECGAPRNKYSHRCDHHQHKLMDFRRKRLGLKPWRPGSRGRRPKEDEIPWERADWSKSIDDLAAEFGVTPSAVAYRRRMTFPEEFREESESRRGRWDKINWRKKNSTIAEELGVTPSAVRYQRLKRKKQRA